MKKKVLLIFKWPVSLHKFLIIKFSKFYDIEHINISDFKDKNFSEITNEINDLIKSKKIEIVFFDVDFMKFLNFFFIKKIECNKKILMTFDDYALHELNAITANSCDLVLSHCPFSVLKYKEKGYEAYCMPCEADSNIFKNYNLNKEIDVLFFGQLNSDRKEFLNFLENKGISVKKVGWNSDYVSEEELSKLISKSKIVLNLSKSVGESVVSHSSENTYKFYYQWKGRVIIAGLCGTLCVSEYSPAHEIMFREEQIPSFHTKEECLKILQKYLKDKESLTSDTHKFCSKILNLWEDENNFKPIAHAIENPKHRKVELLKIPYWYIRISAKQTLIRNVNLFNLIKTIFQLKEVLIMIKNSNLLVKVLILSESILNIMWYSLIATFKSKK